LGAILYKCRDTDEAKSYLDRALRLKPTDSMARYEGAMLKSTSGDYETAAHYRLHRPEDGAKERQIVDRLIAKQQEQARVSRRFSGVAAYGVTATCFPEY
jgi:Flp pilus assembly protein TadD